MRVIDLQDQSIEFGPPKDRPYILNGEGCNGDLDGQGRMRRFLGGLGFVLGDDWNDDVAWRASTQLGLDWTGLNHDKLKTRK